MFGSKYRFKKVQQLNKFFIYKKLLNLRNIQTKHVEFYSCAYYWLTLKLLQDYIAINRNSSSKGIFIFIFLNICIVPLNLRAYSLQKRHQYVRKFPNLM